MSDLDVSQSTLAFIAGYLGGAADEEFNTGREWSMQIYLDMEAGKLDIYYLQRLETRLANIWSNPYPPKIQDTLKNANTST